jgi:hypothetical protein
VLKKKIAENTWMDEETLKLEPFFAKGIIIDTKNQTIVDENNTLLNGMIKQGNIFNIPIGTYWLVSNIPGVLEYHYLYI